MELQKIQDEVYNFLKDRDWFKYSPNDVLIHLYEELSEIGKHLLFKSKYKEEGGHSKPDGEELPREFAQAFSLFLQLCILLDVDLEQAWKNEIKIMRERFPIDK
ncbi:MAG: hypothetical protein GPJ51_03775 [Candidatus Heimdallarchaeota archaeon]|nr:hypothetical protein [Candidatus Heimdallarchaeota archaeon]